MLLFDGEARTNGRSAWAGEVFADPSRSVGFVDVGDSFKPDFLETILSEGD